MRSAAGFQPVIDPRRSMEMMASPAERTICSSERLVSVTSP